jgi:hypothetical protein
MTTAALAAMLQAAVSLLLFVQAHPELPDSARLAAIKNATTAITTVTAELPRLRGASATQPSAKSAWVAPRTPELRVWIKTASSSLPRDFSTSGYTKQATDRSVTFFEGDALSLESALFLPSEGVELGCCDLVYRLYDSSGLLIREIEAAPRNADRTKRIFLPGSQQFDRRLSLFDFERAYNLVPGTYRFEARIDRLRLTESLEFTIQPRSSAATGQTPVINFTANPVSVYKGGVVEMRITVSGARWCEFYNAIASSTSERIAFDSYRYEVASSSSAYTVYCVGYSAENGRAGAVAEKTVDVFVRPDTSGTQALGRYQLNTIRGLETWQGSGTQYEVIQRCKLVYLRSLRQGVTPTGVCEWNGTSYPLEQLPTWQ